MQSPAVLSNFVWALRRALSPAFPPLSFTSPLFFPPVFFFSPFVLPAFPSPCFVVLALYTTLSFPRAEEEWMEERKCCDEEGGGEKRGNSEEWGREKLKEGKRQ
jgi:hypothetical protein